MSAPVLILLTVLALVSPSVASDNETPTSMMGYIHEPYEFDLGPAQGIFLAPLEDQGYIVSWSREPDGDLDNNAGLDEWTAALTAGYGAFQQVSHGSSNGTSVEAYVLAADRDTAWVRHQRAGFPMSQIVKSNSAGGFGISMYASAIGNRFVANKTIVFNGSCYGHDYQGTAWPGSRVRLGYANSCPTITLAQDMINFWPKLAGSNVALRNVDGIKDAGNLVASVDGSRNTTLAPYFETATLSDGAQVPAGGKILTIVFDTKTNRASNPLSITGPFTMSGVAWDDDVTLHATIVPTADGEGYLTARGSVIASKNNSQIYLDGGENFDMRLRHGDNPAAEMEGFTVVDDGVAWKTSSTFKTGHFRIEAASIITGPWTVVADNIAAKIGRQAVTFNASPGVLYRLVEVQTDGLELVHGIDSRHEGMAIPETEPPTLEQLRESIEQRRREMIQADNSATMLTGETLTFYTTPALRDAVEYAYAWFWEWNGVTVNIVTSDIFPQGPDGIRDGIKADIATRAANGETNFGIVADGNDYRQFTGVQYPSFWLVPYGWETIRQEYLAAGYADQSANDLIPTFYVPDTYPRDENTAWFTPYRPTDAPYADVDNDGLRDVVVTRLPVTTVMEVYTYADKLQYYHQGWYGAATASFFVGDIDHDGNSGAIARATADAVEALVPAGVTVRRLYESSVPANSARNDAAAAHWNQYRPEVLFMPATRSNRSLPGNFFDQTNTINPWSMDMIYPSGTHEALIVGTSCGVADFARTEDQDYGTPIAHKMLTAFRKGAIGVVGPTCGTWEDGNDVFARYYAEELFANPSRSAAESFTITLRRVMTDHADEPEVVATVSSYVFLGDPLVPVNRMQIPTDVATSGGRASFSLQPNVPNPFNPRTQISYSVPDAGKVTLRIYNGAGQLVHTLADGQQPAGQYSVLWGGENDQGTPVSSGVYFYRLTAGERTQTRKMHLLK